VRFSPLRQALFSRGVSTCTFDFIGCGDSGGDLGQTSLDSRCEQAGMVIDDQGLKSPLALLGASMGAYTAIKLLKQYDVAHLILIVPAVYTPRAADVPFGQAFSRIIREERSWAESDAWGILAEYTGNLLIVAAEIDAVIPQEIIQRLHDSAVRTRHRHILTIPRAPHHILSYLTAVGADWLDSIAAHIASCLNPASDRTGAAT
jgi:pimeloyl-ACP methyl ester carboxylesterase